MKILLLLLIVVSYQANEIVSIPKSEFAERFLNGILSDN